VNLKFKEIIAKL